MSLVAVSCLLPPTPVFVVLVAVTGELGSVSSSAAGGGMAERVELDTSVKNIDSTAGGGPAVGEGSSDVV